MVDDGALDAALVSTDVRAHQLPHLLLTVLALLGTELRSVQGCGLLVLVALVQVEARVLSDNRLCGGLLVFLLGSGGCWSLGLSDIRLRDELGVDLLLLVEVQLGGELGSSLLS